MAVVDAIQNAPTGRRAGMGDVPVEDVVIKEAVRLQAPAAEHAPAE
jgi:hypothetical protein